MTPDDLASLHERVQVEKDELIQRLEGLAAAASDSPSTDESADIVLEALFLRGFTRYEESVEKLFLHYVTGGHSISGSPASSFLALADETKARRLIRAGFAFLSWSKPAEIKTMASNYLDNGWPFIEVLGLSTDVLSDCTKIRNRIAHRTEEARIQFAAVQRNLFQTERLFDMSPGHLLRCRFRRTKKLVFQHYVEVFTSTLQALADPPE